jgi:hypothetical protein
MLVYTRAGPKNRSFSRFWLGLSLGLILCLGLW